MTEPEATFAPTHVLLTTAPVDAVAASVGEPVPVGRLGDWTVVALDPRADSYPTAAAGRVAKKAGRVLGLLDAGHAVGVCAATGGKSAAMVWAQGWEAPSGRELDRFASSWRSTAADVATLAGCPQQADALAQLLAAPGFAGHGLPLWELLERARHLLGIPAEVVGTSADHHPALTDVTTGSTARRGLFGFGRS